MVFTNILRRSEGIILDHYFDNTYWALSDPDFAGEWTGNSWFAEPGVHEIGLIPINGWEVGYRAQEIRLTVNTISPGPTIQNFFVFLQGGSDTASITVPVSNGGTVIMDISNIQDGDYLGLQITDSDYTHTFHITDIAFLR